MVKDSVIGRNCAVGENCKIINSYIFENCKIEDGCVVSGTILGYNCVVCAGERLPPGTIVSSNVCYLIYCAITSIQILNTMQKDYIQVVRL